MRNEKKLTQNWPMIPSKPMTRRELIFRAGAGFSGLAPPAKESFFGILDGAGDLRPVHEIDASEGFAGGWIDDWERLLRDGEFAIQKNGIGSHFGTLAQSFKKRSTPRSVKGCW